MNYKITVYPIKDVIFEVGILEITDVKANYSFQFNIFRETGYHIVATLIPFQIHKLEADKLEEEFENNEQPIALKDLFVNKETVQQVIDHLKTGDGPLEIAEKDLAISPQYLLIDECVREIILAQAQEKVNTRDLVQLKQLMNNKIKDFTDLLMYIQPCIERLSVQPMQLSTLSDFMKIIK